MSLKVIIVGAGFSGMCMGIRLKQAGIDDFVILDKADGLGGTWRENTYPGAECDVPSALYSYSFAHNPSWDYKWAEQKQILKYQQDTARQYGLEPHFRFKHAVERADFDQQAQIWRVQTANGELFEAPHFVVGVGQLHIPRTPRFEGDDLFQGAKFHSAKWQHDLDLSGKRVAVIGNAASAVQFVPEIVDQVAHMTIFQRSANWMLPKQDRAYKPVEQWLSKKLPYMAKLYRLKIWLRGELAFLPLVQGKAWARRWLQSWSKRFLEQSIDDVELRKKLTPDYPMGAKRVLFADDYYPALLREHVHLDTSGIKRFNSSGIERNDGVSEKFDVVVYSTGFNTNPFLASIDIRGLDGVRLAEHWKSGAHAYLGVNTHGFPNLHMMYGPNTNLGHSSIILMIEAQAGYILQAIQASHNQAVQIRKQVEQDYNHELQRRLSSTAFNQVEQSWYLDDGKITNNWAGGTREYMRRLKNFDAGQYQTI